MSDTSSGTENKAEVPGIGLGFSYSVQLTNGSSLVLQGAVDLSAPFEDQSKTLDKVRKLIERQGTAAEVTRLEGEIEMRKVQLKGVLADVARIDALHDARAKNDTGRDTRSQISKQDREQRAAVVNNAEGLKKNIEDNEERLGKLRASIA